MYFSVFYQSNFRINLYILLGLYNGLTCLWLYVSFLIHISPMSTTLESSFLMDILMIHSLLILNLFKADLIEFLHRLEFFMQSYFSKWRYNNINLAIGGRIWEMKLDSPYHIHFCCTPNCSCRKTIIVSSIYPINLLWTFSYFSMLKSQWSGNLMYFLNCWDLYLNIKVDGY